MELALQRWSWVLSLVATLLAAFLAARIVNTVAGAAIAPKPTLGASAGGATSSLPQAPHEELSPERMAKAFDVPLPKPKLLDEPAPGALAERPHGAWDPVPVRSSLRGLLVSTAVAKPERFSLCQITNQDSNETNVFSDGSSYNRSECCQ